MWTISRALARSTCLQVPEADFSADCFSGGEPSAPSSSTGSAVTFLWRGRTTGPWSRSPYGTTCEVLTGAPGRDAVTSCVADFRASLRERSSSRAAATGRSRVSCPETPSLRIPDDGDTSPPSCANSVQGSERYRGSESSRQPVRQTTGTTLRATAPVHTGGPRREVCAGERTAQQLLFLRRSQIPTPRPGGTCAGAILLTVGELAERGANTDGLSYAAAPRSGSGLSRPSGMPGTGSPRRKSEPASSSTSPRAIYIEISHPSDAEQAEKSFRGRRFACRGVRLTRFSGGTLTGTEAGQPLGTDECRAYLLHLFSECSLSPSGPGGLVRLFTALSPAQHALSREGSATSTTTTYSSGETQPTELGGGWTGTLWSGGATGTRTEENGLPFTICLSKGTSRTSLTARQSTTARTCRPSETVRESGETSPACGASSPESPEKPAPDGFSLRTPPTSSSSGSTSCYRILTRSGTMRNGSVSPRPSSAPPTSGTGYGYLPKQGDPSYGETLGRMKELARRLAAGEDVRLPPKRFAFWPTPTHSDARNTGVPSQLCRQYMPLSCRVRITEDGRFDSRGGRANPEFVEWLMGWPAGWSALGPLATDRFRTWPLGLSPTSTPGSVKDDGAGAGVKPGKAGEARRREDARRGRTEENKREGQWT